MFRESLAPNCGMLFVFDEEARQAIWMKNMRFPLDVIWLNADKVIVDIKTHANPCLESCESLIPQAPAKYALEAPAGFAEKNRIRVGQQAAF